MRREDIESLIPAVADDLLKVWAMFMKRGSVGRGYPTKAAGFSGVGITCWSDLEEEHYSATASQVNTVMVDLADKDYIAISNWYCGRGGRFNSSEIEFLLDAVDRFMLKAKERGLL